MFIKTKYSQRQFRAKTQTNYLKITESMADHHQQYDAEYNVDRSQRQAKIVEKRIRKLTEGIQFLDDFDPEKSTRERRKWTRQCYTRNSPKSLFDEKGQYRNTGLDVCDCLNNGCPGCHFPCNNCKSNKCGSMCRVNRKWAFESIEHDGKDLVVNNKNIESDK